MQDQLPLDGETLVQQCAKTRRDSKKGSQSNRLVSLASQFVLSHSSCLLFCSSNFGRSLSLDRVASPKSEMELICNSTHKAATGLRCFLVSLFAPSERKKKS